MLPTDAATLHESRAFPALYLGLGEITSLGPQLSNFSLHITSGNIIETSSAVTAVRILQMAFSVS